MQGTRSRPLAVAERASWRRRSGWLVWAALVAGWVGCGNGDDGGKTNTAATDASGQGGSGQGGGQNQAPLPDKQCTVISAGDWSAFGTAALRSAVGDKGQVTLNLRTDGKIQQVPGTYDLSTEVGTACSHCLMFRDGKSPAALQATRGHLVVSTVGSPPTSAVSGTLSDVRFDFVHPDSKGGVSASGGGACFILQSASFQIGSSAGKACSTSDDCGTSGSFACDPVSRTCSASVRCEPAKDDPCPADAMCYPQGETMNVWACYAACDAPGTKGTCPGETTCTRDPETGLGICLALGTGAADAACKPSDVDTGCVAGYQCNREVTGATCRKVCDITANDPGCPSGQGCTFEGICAPAAAKSPKLTAACPGGSAVAAEDQVVFCGLEGGAFRGVCDVADGEGSKPTCTPLCRQDGKGSDAAPNRGDPGQWQCPAGTICMDAFDYGYAAGAFGLCEVL